MSGRRAGTEEIAFAPFAAGAGGGLFEHEAYVHASAEHNGSVPVIARAGGAALVLLRSADGGVRTVHGYPEPYGDTSAAALDGLAAGLAASGRRLWIALAPEGGGAALATALARHLEPVALAPICVADLDDDPMTFFNKTARQTVRRAVRDGATAEIGPPRADFGTHYRAAMDELGAADIYLFDDAYIVRLADAGAFQVTVHDAQGMAAAGLFLTHGSRASYHLSGRRGEPHPVPGAMNVVVLEGLRECARRGVTTCILGGGRTHADDDDLLRFKRRMATRVLSRPIFAT